MVQDRELERGTFAEFFQHRGLRGAGLRAVEALDPLQAVLGGDEVSGPLRHPVERAQVGLGSVQPHSLGRERLFRFRNPGPGQRPAGTDHGGGGWRFAF